MVQLQLASAEENTHELNVAILHLRGSLSKALFKMSGVILNRAVTRSSNRHILYLRIGDVFFEKNKTTLGNSKADSHPFTSLILIEGKILFADILMVNV